MNNYFKVVGNQYTNFDEMFLTKRHQFNINNDNRK